MEDNKAAKINKSARQKENYRRYLSKNDSINAFKHVQDKIKEFIKTASALYEKKDLPYGFVSAQHRWGLIKGADGNYFFGLVTDNYVVKTDGDNVYRWYSNTQQTLPTRPKDYTFLVQNFLQTENTFTEWLNKKYDHATETELWPEKYTSFFLSAPNIGSLRTITGVTMATRFTSRQIEDALKKAGHEVNADNINKVCRWMAINRFSENVKEFLTKATDDAVVQALGEEKAND